MLVTAFVWLDGGTVTRARVSCSAVNTKGTTLKPTDFNRSNEGRTLPKIKSKKHIPEFCFIFWTTLVNKNQKKKKKSMRVTKDGGS